MRPMCQQTRASTDVGVRAHTQYCQALALRSTPPRDDDNEHAHVRLCAVTSTQVLTEAKVACYT